MAEEHLPRYVHIERSLRARIAHLQPHELLPSEAELCEEFSVSRMTVRAAVQRLADDGLVYRSPGRGTFVADPRPHRRVERLRGFSAEARRKGVRPSSRVLAAEVRAGGAHELERLRLPAGSSVVDLQRVRLGDDVPIALERTVLPGELGAVLDADLTTTSLHARMRELGRTPTTGTSSIRAERADRPTARLLQVPAGSAVLVEERTVLDGEGRPVELTVSRYAGDRYALDAAFTVAGDDEAGASR
ncbi:GntR family transcriptional regulator [Kineococcus gypseus]|uniref:GntR family transcriptional regulator n=1 Tax=Kineococcus gypseus TaxID=1637102 RepID=UPI003D7EB97B